MRPAASASATRALARRVLTPARRPSLVVTISSVPGSLRRGAALRENQQGAPGTWQCSIEPVLAQCRVSSVPSRQRTSAKNRR
jgi:hypothetical protein